MIIRFFCVHSLIQAPYLLSRLTDGVTNPVLISRIIKYLDNDIDIKEFVHPFLQSADSVLCAVAATLLDGATVRTEWTKLCRILASGLDSITELELLSTLVSSIDTVTPLQKRELLEALEQLAYSRSASVVILAAETLLSHGRKDLTRHVQALMRIYLCMQTQEERLVLSDCLRSSSNALRVALTPYAALFGFGPAPQEQHHRGPQVVAASDDVDTLLDDFFQDVDPVIGVTGSTEHEVCKLTISRFPIRTAQKRFSVKLLHDAEMTSKDCAIGIAPVSASGTCRIAAVIRQSAGVG